MSYKTLKCGKDLFHLLAGCISRHHTDGTTLHYVAGGNKPVSVTSHLHSVLCSFCKNKNIQTVNKIVYVEVHPLKTDFSRTWKELSEVSSSSLLEDLP